MKISQQLMAPGSFELTLRPETPREIVKQLWDTLASWSSSTDRYSMEDGARIVVFDTRTDAPSFDVARYVGHVWKRSGRSTFSGTDMAGYLATSNGVGSTAPQYLPQFTGIAYETWPIDMDSSGDIGDWLYFVMTNADGGSGIGGFVNGGLTFGTTTETGLTNMPLTLTAEQGYLSALEHLDWACAYAGAEWRLNPDGTIDVGQPTYLFDTTPTVLLTDEPIPTTQTGSPKVFAADIGFELDMSEAVNAVYVSPGVIGSPSDVGFTSGTDRPIGPTGEDVERGKWVQPSGATASNADTLSDNIFADLRYGVASYSATTSEDHIRSHLEPGDAVWIWSPWQGVESTQLVNTGLPTYPQIVRTVGINWGVTPGHGVYMHTHNGTTETWTDLTDYVVWSQQGASLSLIANDPTSVIRSHLTGGGRLGTDSVILKSPAPAGRLSRATKVKPRRWTASTLDTLRLP